MGVNAVIHEFYSFILFCNKIIINISSHFFEIQLFTAFRLSSLMSHRIKTLMFALDFEETECWNSLVNCFSATVMEHVITPKTNITDFVTLGYILFII